MKIRNFLTIALAGGILMTGCNNDEGLGMDGNQGELTYATVVLQNSVLTKAGDGTSAGTEDERRISKVELYVFDETGARDLNTHNGYAVYTGDDATGARKYVPVNAGDKFILVAVNMDLGVQAGVNLDALKNIISEKALPGTAPYEVPAAGIPMTGINTTAVSVAAGTNNNEVAVSLSRLYARINTPTTVSQVVVEIPDEELEGIGLDPANVKFDFVGYAVVNGINKSYVMSAAGLADWSKDAVMSYHKATYYGENESKPKGSIKTIYSGEKGNNGFFYSDINDDFIYAYENVPQKKTNGSFELLDPSSVYALIVKGTLTDENNVEKVRYWRVNLSKDQDYKIYRNAYFNTLIQKVTTVGYETPEEAEEDDEKPIPVPGESGIIARISILDWNIFLDVTDL